MGLLDDLTPPTRRWPCAVRAMLETLDKSDADVLAAAVMNPAWKYSALESALFDKGLTLSQGTIKRHREKACSCWKV